MFELIAGIFPGIGEMTNLHPLVVHYPIALLTAFLLLEFLGFILARENLSTAATWMLYLGAIGAVVTVIAGLKAAGGVSHAEVVHSIMERHEQLGIAVLIMAVFLSIWRLVVKGTFSAAARVIHLAVAFIMVVTMVFGADMGGLMVYKYGVAVKAVPQPEAHEHRPGEGHGKETGGHAVGGGEGSEEHEAVHSGEEKMNDGETHEDSHNHEGDEPHGH